VAGERQPATVREALALAVRALAASGADSPRLTAELFAARAFGLSRVELITRDADAPAPEQLEALHALVARRAAGEPAAYILGEREFYGLPLRVTPDVLIPRPETECLVEEVQRLFPPSAPLVFADFGTGSGALAVALAHEFPAARGLAVDLSAQALAIARENAEANGVADRLEFRNADFTALEFPPATFDCIVSNPPYVTEDEYAGLEREVRGHEPRLALVSPEQGLAHIRGLLPVAAQALRPGGVLLVEHGCDQGPAARALAADPTLGFTAVATLKDYAGLDRILKAVRMCANAKV
jgi:release factor glutamine methyltransferase